MARKTLILMVLLTAGLALVLAQCGDNGSGEETCAERGMNGADGDSCDATCACNSGLRCMDDSLCAPAGALDQLCLADSTCDAGLRCMLDDTCSDEVPLDRFAGESSTSYCDWIFRCCTETERTNMDESLDLEGSLADESTCRINFTAGSNTQFVTHVQDAVASGHGTYSATAAASCLNEVDALACVGSTGDLTGLFHICVDAYEGNQGQDDPCVRNLECQVGHQCMTGTSTCQAWLTQGAACTDGAESICGDGLYCTDPDGLQGGTCEARKAPGVACADLNLECDVGLTCDATLKECVEADLGACDGL